jgi:hypothetical protein
MSLNGNNRPLFIQVMFGCSSNGITDPDLIFSKICAIPLSADAFHLRAAVKVRDG